ncbi:MAG: hypothetical protein HQK53_12055 [Oligoflexia bacterium]|nr:hypothetical protein [Oligoflexia bacterium]
MNQKSNKSRTIYYCHQCKKIVHDIREIFFVEQGRYRGFCSEGCITAFFAPLIEYLRLEEKKVRKEMQIDESLPFTNRDFEKIIEYTLNKPKEIWLGVDELSENFCYIISKINLKDLVTDGPKDNAKGNVKDDSKEAVFCIVIALLFDDAPSFVLTEIVTKSEFLVDFYRKGELLGDSINLGLEKKIPTANGRFLRGTTKEKRKDGVTDSAADEISNDMPSGESEYLPNSFVTELPPELASLIDNKREIMAAELVNQRSSTDIPIETFPRFEVFISETVDKAEEVYRFVDQDKDVIFIYIRTYLEDNQPFYYIVLCFQYNNDMENEEGLLIPFFSFPTSDPDLYKRYKRGEKIGGPSIN